MVTIGAEFGEEALNVLEEEEAEDELIGLTSIHLGHDGRWTRSNLVKMSFLSFFFNLTKYAFWKKTQMISFELIKTFSAPYKILALVYFNLKKTNYKSYL